MAQADAFEYATWAEFRFEIRKYLRLAEAAAREAGLEPQQHQLLLAVRGFPGPGAPTIGEVAERLQLRHHSTVELVDRMEARGLIVRRPAPRGRAVRIILTPLGRRSLDAVSRRLKPELASSAAQLIETLSRLAPPDGAPVPKSAAASASSVRKRSSASRVRTAAVPTGARRTPPPRARATASRSAAKPRAQA